MRRDFCELCKQFGFVDRHHIHAKSKGGNNKPYNIIQVCPNCHRKIHAGQIVIQAKVLTTLGWRVVCDAPNEFNQHQYIFGH